MARVSREPGRKDRWRVQFDFNGRSHTVRLGRISERDARRFRDRVDDLLAAAISGHTAPDLAEWIGRLDDTRHARLAKSGLVAPRQKADAVAPRADTLSTMLDAYFAALDVKESTRTRYEQGRERLERYFKGSPPLRSIGSMEADQWRAWLVAEKFSKATVSRDVGLARMFFAQAVRWGLIPSNPFEGVKAGPQKNRERQRYITPEETDRLLAAAPNDDWRCIIALTRWGGMRCPSEVLGVKWADIDWAGLTLRVQSPKTEHHDGQHERVIPLFPELHEVLLPAFERADDGATFVVAGYRDQGATNLRSGLLRIIRRAGLNEWPKPFVNLRASRATELVAEYPKAVSEAWMGHSEEVGKAHYHMVRASDLERAARERTPRYAQSHAPVPAPSEPSATDPTQKVTHKVTQHGGAPERTEQQPHSESPEMWEDPRRGAHPCASVQNQVWAQQDSNL